MSDQEIYLEIAAIVHLPIVSKRQAAAGRHSFAVVAETDVVREIDAESLSETANGMETMARGLAVSAVLEGSVAQMSAYEPWVAGPLVDVHHHWHQTHPLWEKGVETWVVNRAQAKRSAI